MRDLHAVHNGSTSCLPTATAAARVRIMSNINEYIDLVKATCVDPSEVDGAILENFGELPTSYVPRVSGSAKGSARLGLINDFAAYTAKTPFQVMVIDSRNIWSDTSDAIFVSSLFGKLRSRLTQRSSSLECSAQFYITATTTWGLFETQTRSRQCSLPG